MNIIIIDDHQIFAQGVAELIKRSHLDVNNIFMAFSGKEGLAYFNNQHAIDVVITDLNLPHFSGIQVIEYVRQNYPKTKVVVLTQYYSKALTQKLNDLSVDGYLTKNLSHQEIISALWNISSNKKFISQEVKSVFDEYDFSFSSEDTIIDGFIKKHSLSPREVEIMKLLVTNMTNQEIGDQVNISMETVRTHRKNIYRKIGVNNVLDLFKFLRMNDLI